MSLNLIKSFLCPKMYLCKFDAEKAQWFRRQSSEKAEFKFSQDDDLEMS